MKWMDGWNELCMYVVTMGLAGVAGIGVMGWMGGEAVF